MTTLDKLSLVPTTALSSNNEAKGSTTADSTQQRHEVAESGKAVPASDPADAILTAKKKELDQAVKDVSGYVQNITRELQFSVDEELGSFVVKVVDQETGETIRQIPTDEMLELAKTLTEVRDRTSKGILFQGDA